MKVAALIVRHLAEKKIVSFQGIGVLYLDQPAIIEGEQISFPESSIRFEQNPRTTADEALIQFAVDETKKIRSLVHSDIDSFIQLGQQFLHLGKPFDISGLGSLRRNFKGEIEFLQNSQPASITEKIPSSVKEKKMNEISFASLPRKKNRFKPLPIMIGIMILLALVSLYYFMSNHNKRQEMSLHTSDSASNKNQKKTNSPSPTQQSFSKAETFRIVLKEYPSLAKAKNYSRRITTKHQLEIFTDDSIRFKVAIVFQQSLSDTTAVKDSIQHLLGLKTYIDIP